MTISIPTGVAAGSSLPAGGARGRVLRKKTVTDGDAVWTPTQTGPGLGPGGFRRVNRGQPIIDLTSLGTKLAFRNCRGVCDEDTGTYYVFGDVGANNGLQVQPQCQIGMAKGTSPDLDDLVYQGVQISNAMMTSAGIGATHDALATSCPIRDSNGLWHIYPSSVDAYYGASPNVGEITHWTAASPDGPWTYHDTVISGDGTTNVPTDNGNPVFWNGQWVMPITRYDLPPGGNRFVRWLTASSLDGPWTLSGTIPANVGGYPLTKDAPQLIVNGGKLFLLTVPDTYVMALYEVTTNLATAKFIKPVVNVVAAANTEGSDAGWGAGSIFSGPGGDLLAVWQGGGPSSTDAGYWRCYGGRWVPGEIFSGRDTSSAWINDQTIGSGGTTFTIPTDIPAECYAIDLYYEARETGTFTPQEYCQADQGFDWNYGRAFPPAQNISGTFHGRLDLAGGSRTVRLKSVNATTMKVFAYIYGYWRLP